MSLNLLVLYLATWSIVALTPGPAVLCVTSQTTRFGFHAGLAGVAGTQVGNLVFFAFIATGLATLLSTAAAAFTVLRIVGAVYLCYLGARLVVASFPRKADSETNASSPHRSRHSLFLQGLLVQLTNPKALLFVSALVPQFIEPGRPFQLQILILFSATVGVDLIVLSTYGWFAAKGAQSLRGSAFTCWLERALGGALAVFGLRLLFSRK